VGHSIGAAEPDDKPHDDGGQKWDFEYALPTPLNLSQN
jgi:hypothetical protein